MYPVGQLLQAGFTRSTPRTCGDYGGSPEGPRTHGDKSRGHETRPDTT